MRVSVITPTCDRPDAFRLTERWMARQTVQPDEWIVADGGQTPAPCTQGQRHVHQPAPPGVENFAANLLTAAQAAAGEILVGWEDDDWYAPTHLARLLQAFDASESMVAGDDQQRYYHVATRRTRCFQNVGASFCQTAFRRELLPIFYGAIAQCRARNSYGIDRAFWEAVPVDQWVLAPLETVVGIKGLPGQAGLGVGHRPTAAWTSDPDLAILRSWMGSDADVYTAYVQGAAS
jgi:hypothetical protein